MHRFNRLAWKLSAVVLLIVTAVILGTGLIGSLLSRRYALAAARRIMHVSSATLRGGLDEVMLGGGDAGSLEFLERLPGRNPGYRDVRLVAHPSARPDAGGPPRAAAAAPDRSDRSCRLCHASDEPPAAVPAALDQLITGPDGRRLLQVVTPIVNRSDCRSAACHAHAASGRVLGLLTAQYSLAGFDDLMGDLNLLLAGAALAAVLLVAAALLIMVRAQLARPLRQLVGGIDTLAGGDLAFRFPAAEEDEIGQVEEAVNDLADRIQAQQMELGRARDYLEGIVENSADLIVTVSTDGLIRTFNRGAVQALGYEADEVIGQRVEMLFADPRERDTAIARLREQDSVTNWETRFRARDGRICHVMMTLSRLRNRSGELIGTLGISKDITIEKKLQRKLIQTESEAAIGRAVTAIQHAIKNMLNTLRGGLYVAQVGHRKGEQALIMEGCGMIEEGTARISDLSLNMLKYAREWTIEPEPTDLAAMIRRIEVAVGRTAAEQGVALRTEIDASLPPVPCDPRLIHMGLMDIVSNALDACAMKDYAEGERPAVAIGVRTADDGEGALIEIRDNGIGMTQEVMDNVFTPFFSTKKTWGTGLGLALTHRVIGLHDGQIAVASEVGEGSVFGITLPFAGRGQTGGGR